MSNTAVSLWFDNQAEDAMNLYTSLFKSSKIKNAARYSAEGAKMSGQKEGTVMTVNGELENLEVVCINGGPIFKHTAAFSLFVACQSDDEIRNLWSKLSEGGKPRMGLDKYPWAQKYGWTADRFGVEWQLILNPQIPKRICPSLLFVDKLFGRGEEAVGFYTSVFPDSKIMSMTKDDKTKTIAHCAFQLCGEPFTLMEGAGDHGHVFTEAMAIIVYCDNQKQIDDYWSKLTSNGGKESPCGWCKDKFGVSWQILPRAIGKLMSDPKKAGAVMGAIGKMKKVDLAALEAAR